MKDLFIKALVVTCLFLGPVGAIMGATALKHAYTAEKSQAFGSFNPTGGSTYLLQSSISSTQNTIPLTSFTEPGSGIPYTMSYINTDVIYGTISPSSGNSEFISATGITQNANGTATLTGVTRGETRTPGTGGCVASSTLAHGYPGQTQFILANTPCFYSEYAVKKNNETISGLYTFTQPPVGINPGGSPNASQSVNGLVQIATELQAASSTRTGTSGAIVVIAASSSTSTPSAKCGLCVPVTQNNGKLHQGFIDFTQLFTFTGGLISTASSTFSATSSILALNVATNTPPTSGAYKFALGGSAYFSGGLSLGTGSSTNAGALAASLVGTSNLTISGTCIGCANGVETKTATGAGPTSSGAQASVAVSCSAGKRVLGGGGSDSLSSSAPQIVASYADTSASWTVTYQATVGSGSGASTMTVYAICVNP